MKNFLIIKTLLVSFALGITLGGVTVAIESEMHVIGFACMFSSFEFARIIIRNILAYRREF